jgi:predicted flap endonuclease-1-like 5' DNA nuclease
MRVKNNWKRPIRIGRQVIAKGAVENVAEHLLLQPRVQKLRKTGKLIFPFHDNPEEAAKRAPKPAELNKEMPPAEEPEGQPDEPVTPDDLTQLVHIGTGRSKNLNSFGIFTFAQVVEHADNLHEILDIPAGQAAEVVEDAKSKVG